MKTIVISLVAVALIFIGCGDEKQTANEPMQKQQMPPLPVEAYTVKLEKAEFTKSYPAILKPFQEVEVVARVNGLLVVENFTEGSYVKKGDLLFEIEKDEYEAALDAAKGAFFKSEANYKKSSKNWDRAAYLFENKAISEQQRDDMLYAYEDAKAELQRAKAALKNAQIQYNYTTIKAPISGIIGISNSDEGSYIASKNSVLSTITALDSVYAEFSIPSSDFEQYMSQIKLGANVSIKSGATLHDGLVDYIAPKLDAQTDTLLIRAKFKNEKRELLIGSFSEVILSGFSYDNVAKIPQKTLIKKPDAVFVYVIKGDTLSMRSVDIVHIDEGVAIVRSGLEEGEKIVMSNIAKLKANSKVSIIDGK